MAKVDDRLIPMHYLNENKVDVIDFCKMYNLNFNRGNIVKYLARAGKKDNELQDLRKALTYLEREIEHFEALQTEWIENNR
jgi:hypothetical protein